MRIKELERLAESLENLEREYVVSANSKLANAFGDIQRLLREAIDEEYARMDYENSILDYEATRG